MITITIEQFEEAQENQSGFCIACGEEADGVEPDAHEYTCDHCNTNNVYGAEELLLMGRVT